MASTYPLEIVEADRWAKANAQLKGDALATALEQQTWDPSVRSLVNFPQVLAMLSEKLDTTVKLGDAFIGQQKQVMDTIQALRKKAMDQGTLQSGSQQIVAQSNEGGTQTIVIQPADPSVIYVPVYDPTVVYGTWAYPAYPPYYYQPPGYHPSSAWAFTAGVAVGAAWGYAWGSCNWHGGDIDIDVDKNVNINNHIDRNSYRAQFGAAQGGATAWRHDVDHRQGVAYRDAQTAQRYGGASSAQAAQAREAFRGRTDGFGGAGGAGDAGGLGGAGGVGGAGGLGTGGSGTRPGGFGDSGRDSLGGASGGGFGGDRGGALSGIDRGGASAMASSARGAASRGSFAGGRRGR
jgi:hypothetical protein